MIKTLVAHTFEVDEPELAVAEILNALDLEANLRKNSVGIVACHTDCLSSGVFEALAKSLPFDLVGVTTLASSAGGGMGMHILTISVLTSDEVAFSTAVSAPLADSLEQAVAPAYADALARLSTQPAFMLAYLPFMDTHSGEAIACAVDAASGGVPFFGTLPCDHLSDFRLAQVLYNGKAYGDRLALVLMSGPVAPKFFYIAISDGNVQQQKGRITAAEGNRLISVNNMPAEEYLAALGLPKAELLESSQAVPFMVDYGDGSQPVSRGIYMRGAENGVLCGGNLPLGGTLAVAVLDAQDVLRSTGQVLDLIDAAADGNRGLLVISCITRSLVFDSEPLAEAEAVHKRLPGSLPWHMIYSGGEVCPSKDGSGKTVNRFHNFSFTACVF